jgi:alanine dehydrogenase
METVILTKDDVRLILEKMGLKAILESVEEAFLSLVKKQAQMPPKSYIITEKGDFRAMPGLVGYDVGVKWVNSHPENPVTSRLPSVMGLIIYSDANTGYPLAIMDGTLITQYRTGAAGGIASKYLANPDSSTLGIIGCGKQAVTQFLFIQEVMDIKSVRLWDVNMNNAKDLQTLINKISPNITVEISPIEKTCDTDILVTATPSRKPLVKNEWIREGIHINAIGADAEGKEELDPMILKRAKIVVDELEQASHSGEINVPLKKGIISLDDIHGELGEIIAKNKSGRENEKEITVFDSTGLAVQDLALAGEIYRFSLSQNLGKRIEIV